MTNKNEKLERIAAAAVISLVGISAGEVAGYILAKSGYPEMGQIVSVVPYVAGALTTISYAVRR